MEYFIQTSGVKSYRGQMPMGSVRIPGGPSVTTSCKQPGSAVTVNFP